MASLYFFSCSASTGMTLQLLACLSRVPASLHNLEHFFTLSYSLPLHESHLNIGLLIAKIQANLVRNKVNKMVD